MNDATLYTGQDDFDSIVLRWLVLEKQCPVTVKRLGPHTMHTVRPPYFVERDLQLFDHWVIVQYLQERYPGEQLMPIDPQIRGSIRQICTLLREDIDVDEGDLYDMLNPKENYLLGDSLTLADIYAGVWLRKCGFGSTKMARYMTRLEERTKLRIAI